MTWTLFDPDDKATWPPVGELVLVYGRPGSEQYGNWDVARYERPYEGDDGWWTFDDLLKSYFVSAWWQPLPPEP